MEIIIIISILILVLILFVNNIKHERRLKKEIKEIEDKLGRKIDTDDLGIPAIPEFPYTSYSSYTIRKLVRRKHWKDFSGRFKEMLSAYMNPTKKP